MLLTPLIENILCHLTVCALSRDLSDHTPLLLSIGEKAKVENCWFKRPDFNDLVIKTLNENRRGGSSLDKWHKCQWH
jgi:hypothetical protein